MFTQRVGMLWTILTISCAAAIGQQPADERSAIFDLPAGQELRMDLSAGEYRIEGSNTDQVRVRWSSSDPSRLNKVRVRFATERGRTTLETEHTKDTKVTIHIPSHSNLYIRLSAGELRVSGITGHKDIGLTAGELHVDVGDPASYRQVRSSVRIGDITAEPFQIKKGGFFRGFELTGTGDYSLVATVGVGEVVLTR